MNPESVVEIFLCPHCLKLDYTTNMFVSWENSDVYACKDRCRSCGKELRIVDSIQRCANCNKQINCLGEPVSVTHIVALISITKAEEGSWRNNKIGQQAILEISRIIKKYGRCIKQDFQQVTYADRKNLHN
jgi:hypothetical protein